MDHHPPSSPPHLCLLGDARNGIIPSITYYCISSCSLNSHQPTKEARTRVDSIPPPRQRFAGRPFVRVSKAQGMMRVRVS
jgi:hypothetical protein